MHLSGRISEIEFKNLKKRNIIEIASVLAIIINKKITKIKTRFLALN